MKLSTLYKRHIRIVPGVKSYVLATGLVFVLGMVVTLLSWYVDRQRIQTEQTTQLNQQVASIQLDIANRLAIYEQILRGASGLFSASDLVTRDDWRRYIQQYDLEKTYPGAAGITYVQHVPAASLEGYTQAIRAEGFSDFSVTPAGARPEYAPVTYVEPFGEGAKKALGTDIYSDPIRNQLASQVRDSGKTGISERLTLLTDRGSNNNSSFVMYLAIYLKDTKPTTVEERRANLGGFINAGYRSADFFKGAINPSNLSAYSDIQIFDGSTADQNALLYESAGYRDADPEGVTQTYTANFFTRDWTFRFAGPINGASGDLQRSNIILIGGTTISFAIAGFLFLVMLTRARAIVYSKQNETQQAKDDLLSLASHQLRTPATAVKQYLGMILEGYTGAISKKQLPALQKAYASNERQLDTINQILYVAKADAGRLTINPHTFNINMLIDEIALDVADTLEQNEQSLIIKRPRKKLKVYADDSSLRMVIENLISNASKYSHKGAKITVRTTVKNDSICIEIIDKGIGIAAEDFDKLFQKFSRIDNDLSLQVGGSGIGLYIDKVLIELHGGKIEVTSEPGKGSTFTINLPQSSPSSANNLTDGTVQDSS
ncbi:MAG: CHASE domain-containing sensor histidine kinase [Candidatus Saccharimonadales bacterium]